MPTDVFFQGVYCFNQLSAEGHLNFTHDLQRLLVDPTIYLHVCHDPPLFSVRQAWYDLSSILAPWYHYDPLISL
jgi:hypothetical protein